MKEEKTIAVKMADGVYTFTYEEVRKALAEKEKEYDNITKSIGDGIAHIERWKRDAVEIGDELNNLQIAYYTFENLEDEETEEVK